MFVGGFIGSPKMNFISSKILQSFDATEVDIMGMSKYQFLKCLHHHQRVIL